MGEGLSGFGFAELALVVVAGLAGPLLGAAPALRLPVIVGELIAGLVLGRTGFGVLDPGDQTFALLANIGFALVMFVVGTHVPVRQMAKATIPAGAARALLVGLPAIGLALLLARFFHTGNAAVYAVLMASSSAAIALPIIQGLRLSGTAAGSIKDVTAQIAIADSACIVLLPLAINPPRAATAGLGALAVAASAVVFYAALKYADRRGLGRKLHRYSEDNHLALELRTSLLVLFTLCAVAIATHVSIMLAGFAIGLVVNAVGEPRRLARQLFGITEGFFAPLFFVWLGASLQVRELVQHPAFLGLGVALGLGAVLAHSSVRLLGQPLVLASMASAQLGVPVAAATLGAESHLLAPGEPAALILGALITIAVASIAGRIASRTLKTGASPV